MVVPRTRRIIAHALAALALAAALIGGVRVLTGTAAASGTYSAPTYGTPMLDMGDAS
jgi:hypothetical protein